MRRYTVTVGMEDLHFAAAHFITYEGGVCESLHGHNYRVAVTVEGSLNQAGYVCDFIRLRDLLAGLLQELDHSVLLATEHPGLIVTREEDEIRVEHKERRYLFPAGDVSLLPISNTTAELIAEHLIDRIAAELSAEETGGLRTIEIAIEESPGFVAAAHRAFGDAAAE